MNTIRPVGDKILVMPTKAPRNPTGKVVVPDTARWEGDGDHEFWVVAVSSKITDIKPNDRIICVFDHESVQPVYESDPHRRGFIRRSQVLAVFPS